MAGPFFGHFLCLEVGSYSSVFRLEVFNKKAFSIFDLASEALAPVRERQREEMAASFPQEDDENGSTMLA